MFYMKQICLIIYIIITVLFTVGFATQPIVSNYSTSITPTNMDGKTQVINTNLYITHFDNIISDFKGTYTQNTDYASIDNNKLLIFRTLFYMCIGITCILVIGIILALIGLKFISKILFIITLVLMIIVFLIIQISIISSSIINIVASGKFTKPEVSNGNGYYLILTATCMMFVNNILYTILA